MLYGNSGHQMVNRLKLCHHCKCLRQPGFFYDMYVYCRCWFRVYLVLVLAFLFPMQRRNHELAALLEQHSSMNTALVSQIEDLVRTALLVVVR